MAKISKKLLPFIKDHMFVDANSWNTGILANAYGGGGTIFVLYSTNTSNGDGTVSSVGVIRLGYDGNNVHYYSIYNGNETYGFNGNLALSVDSNGYLVLTPNRIMQMKVTLIYQSI